MFNIKLITFELEFQLSEKIKIKRVLLYKLFRWSLEFIFIFVIYFKNCYFSHFIDKYFWSLIVMMIKLSFDREVTNLDLNILHIQLI